MASFAERVETLRGTLLGDMQKQDFCKPIRVKPGAYSNWLSGSHRPNRDNLEAISDRWQVSIDSLLGMNGTEQLEPSPALRKVQDALLFDFSQGDTEGTPEKRATILFRRITAGTGMSIDAWCEWIQTPEETWSGIMDGLYTLNEIQHKQIAFLAGWYQDQQVWMDWISTGQADVLAPATRRNLDRMVATLARAGMTYDELLKRLR